ncbi:MAG TPA: DUF1552 domain-containing protein [Polyangiaceae bacterium]|nr:DUF1552 domain-containing protein [Polyangiaceae bacterium]
MWPRSAQAATLGPRYVGIYFANGAYLPQWIPSELGPLNTLSKILAPAVGIEEVKSDLLVVSGLDNKPAHPNYPSEDGGGDHATGVAAMLTCAPCSQNGETSGISIDQVIANHYQMPLKSMQLGLTDGGASDKGFSAVYSANLSWSDANTWLPKITDAAAAFDLLFQNYDPTVSAQEAAKRRALKLSVLDEVETSATQLWNQLGATDRQKLDQWFTGIRQLEKRIEAGEASCGMVSPPAGGGGDLTAASALMIDVMAKGLICDRTRVMTLLLDHGFSDRSYGFINAGGAHHGASHHGRAAYPLEAISAYFNMAPGDVNRPAALAGHVGVDEVGNYEKMTTWQVEQFVKLAKALKDVVEPDGKTLLDKTIMFMSSDVSDGDEHWHEEMPVLMAGGGGGAITPGRHVRFDRGKVAGIHLACAQACGVPLTMFGDATSPLTLT